MIAGGDEARRPRRAERRRPARLRDARAHGRGHRALLGARVRGERAGRRSHLARRDRGGGGAGHVRHPARPAAHPDRRASTTCRSRSAAPRGSSGRTCSRRSRRRTCRGCATTTSAPACSPSSRRHRTTPGRMNMIRVRGGGRVLVDYAHNAAAIEGLVDFVWQHAGAEAVLRAHRAGRPARRRHPRRRVGCARGSTT